MIYLKTIDIAVMLACILGFTLINPIGDAIRDSGKKKLQKRLELGRDFLVFLMLYVLTKNHQFVVCLGLSYFFFRISLHNMAYNLSHRPKAPWWATGTTSDTDYIEAQIREETSLGVIVLSRVFTFIGASFMFYLSIRMLG